MDERIEVVLVDDHPLFLDGLAGLLSTTADLYVVAQGRTGVEAVTLADQYQPDVMVLDLDMPDLGGVEATRRIVGASPHVRILILTMLDDDALVFDAVRAGARGYLLKEAEPDDVLTAVRAVARGEAVFGTALANRLTTWFGATHPEPFVQLTPREREVLDLLARSLTNAVIAQRLGISAKTVRNLVSNVLTKLQLADRAAAISAAREAGLGRR